MNTLSLTPEHSNTEKPSVILGKINLVQDTTDHLCRKCVHKRQNLELYQVGFTVT